MSYILVAIGTIALSVRLITTLGSGDVTCIIIGVTNENNNDTITDEKRLTPENIEELRRLIKEDMKKINGLYKDDLENWKSDKHENSMDQREKID